MWATVHAYNVIVFYYFTASREILVCFRFENKKMRLKYRKGGGTWCGEGWGGGSLAYHNRKRRPIAAKYQNN